MLLDGGNVANNPGVAMHFDFCDSVSGPGFWPGDKVKLPETQRRLRRLLAMLEWLAEMGTV